MKATADVFQTQQSFRTLMNCMARPGKVGKLDDMKLSGVQDMNTYLITAVYTLFDREVSFHIGQSGLEIDKTVQLMTMSSAVSIETCDFLIADGKETIPMEKLKRGRLEYPDGNATVICQIDKISEHLISGSDTNAKQLQLTLSGPGIKDTIQIFLDGLSSSFISQFVACNDDYPLGIDAILVDWTGNVVCFPRTVQMTWEVV